MTQAIRPFAPQSPNPSDPSPRGGSGPTGDGAHNDGVHTYGSLEDKARFFDYREAANPVRKGLTEPIGYRQWGPSLHSSGPTAVLPLDTSAELGCPSPATSPGLAASFLRLEAGDSLAATARSSSSLFFVLKGQGQVERKSSDLGHSIQRAWGEGDLFVLPAGAVPTLSADVASVLYWVHDGPLLTYLGVKPSEPRFEATFYGGERLKSELHGLMQDPSSQRSNRLSILLANADLPASRTVSHTLWAMYGAVRAGSCQPPHRHQSVAIDLIIDCDPGCYTLVGPTLADDGSILNPTRIEWEPGGVFVTPPGHWHAHVNESGKVAHLLPIQDAGLHTYLRSLDIRFSG